MHHQHALYLERPYAVAAGLDNVVVAADVPVIAVLVAVRGVAGVVHSVVPRFVSQLLAVVVSAEKSGGAAVFAAHDYFPDFADCNRTSVCVHKIDIVQR